MVAQQRGLKTLRNRRRRALSRAHQTVGQLYSDREPQHRSGRCGIPAAAISSLSSLFRSGTVARPPPKHGDSAGRRLALTARCSRVGLTSRPTTGRRTGAPYRCLPTRAGHRSHCAAGAGLGGGPGRCSTVEADRASDPAPERPRSSIAERARGIATIDTGSACGLEPEAAAHPTLRIRAGRKPE
jgi:hypothetical protein